MDDGFRRITPDEVRARSILKMVDTTMEMIDTLDTERFPSNVIKEYYDVIRELLSVILLLDGYKTYGDGAHKRLIDYIKANYGNLTEHECIIIDDLRITRNRIAYDGFFIDKDYLVRKKKAIQSIVQKLREMIDTKIQSS